MTIFRRLKILIRSKYSLICQEGVWVTDTDNTALNMPSNPCVVLLPRSLAHNVLATVAAS
jgi:hypothetical protein